MQNRRGTASEVECTITAKGCESSISSLQIEIRDLTQRIIVCVVFLDSREYQDQMICPGMGSFSCHQHGRFDKRKDCNMHVGHESS